MRFLILFFLLVQINLFGQNTFISSSLDKFSLGDRLRDSFLGKSTFNDLMGLIAPGSDSVVIEIGHLKISKELSKSVDIIERKMGPVYNIQPLSWSTQKLKDTTKMFYRQLIVLENPRSILHCFPMYYFDLKTEKGGLFELMISEIDRDKDLLEQIINSGDLYPTNNKEQLYKYSFSELGIDTSDCLYLSKMFTFEMGDYVSSIEEIERYKSRLKECFDNNQLLDIYRSVNDTKWKSRRNISYLLDQFELMNLTDSVYKYQRLKLNLGIDFDDTLMIKESFDYFDALVNDKNKFAVFAQYYYSYELDYAKALFYVNKIFELEKDNMEAYYYLISMLYFDGGDDLKNVLNRYVSLKLSVIETIDGEKAYRIVNPNFEEKSYHIFFSEL